MRLEQILFTQGFGTRHECRGLIALGQVTVAGDVVTDPDADVDTQDIVFAVKGEPWPYREKALLMMNKPTGYECSQKPIHHPSVMQLLEGPLRRRGVQPVGRLDADTTGLLIFTDDGGLLHRLTHPKRHVPKRYRVTCRHAPTDKMIADLLEGVLLKDEKEKLAAADIVRAGECTIDMTITSGKYHQVKRMVAAAGNRVDALERIAFGALTLPGDLKPGEWRWLPGSEVFYGKTDK